MRRKLCACCITHNARCFRYLISHAVEHFALYAGLWAHLPWQRMMIKDDTFFVVRVEVHLDLVT
jgi:hypothetical protein